jgi:hypothetical protein
MTSSAVLADRVAVLVDLARSYADSEDIGSLISSRSTVPATAIPPATLIRGGVDVRPTSARNGGTLGRGRRTVAHRLGRGNGPDGHQARRRIGDAGSDLSSRKRTYWGHVRIRAHTRRTARRPAPAPRLRSTATMKMSPEVSAGSGRPSAPERHVRSPLGTGQAARRPATSTASAVRPELPWRTCVRRAVALPSRDGCRSGTARVHPRRGARHRLPCLRRARACRRDLSHQLTSPPRSRRYRRQRTHGARWPPAEGRG